jgi:hypothetical protein
MLSLTLPADGLEPVTLFRQDDPPGSAGTPVAHALRRKAATHGISAADGRAPTTSVAWHLPVAELPVAPRPGDVILDSTGLRWTVLETSAATLGSRWQCLAILGGDSSLQLVGIRDDLPVPPPDTLVTYRMNFGGQAMTLPSYNLRWQLEGSVPVAPDAVPCLRVPITEHQITWHRVASPPWDAIRTCQGAVNADVFLGAAAETLLFDGASATPEFVGFDAQNEPQFAWRLVFVFREKAIKLMQADGESTFGWNHAYRGLPPDSAWDRLVDEQGNTLYREADFAMLFSV